MNVPAQGATAPIESDESDDRHALVGGEGHAEQHG